MKAGFYENGTLNTISNNEDGDVVQVLDFSSEYLQCDQDLVCYGIMTDDDIAEKVIGHDSNAVPDESDGDDEDVFSNPQNKISSKLVLESVEVLRTFCLEKDIDIECSFEKIETYIVKDSFKEKQCKITDFF